MRLSSMNLAIGGLLSGTFIYALQHGLPTPIYFDVAEYGWAYTLLSTVLLFVAVDGLAYYAHRLLHIGRCSTTSTAGTTATSRRRRGWSRRCTRSSSSCSRRRPSSRCSSSRSLHVGDR
jgi:hypothetical protein